MSCSFFPLLFLALTDFLTVFFILCLFAFDCAQDVCGIFVVYPHFLFSFSIQGQKQTALLLCVSTLFLSSVFCQAKFLLFGRRCCSL